MAGCSMVALWVGGSLCARREGASNQISQKMEEHELVVDYRFNQGQARITEWATPILANIMEILWILRILRKSNYGYDSDFSLHVMVH